MTDRRLRRWRGALACVALAPCAAWAEPFHCHWGALAIVDGSARPAPATRVEAPGLAVTFRSGQIVDLAACGVVVGFAFVGDGEVSVRGFGPERGFALYNRFENLPGDVAADLIWAVDGDGRFAALRPPAEGGAPVPASIRERLGPRLAAFDPSKQSGGSPWPPGPTLHAPDPSLGGAYLECVARGLRRRTRTDLEIRSDWLAWRWAGAVWSPEPGAWSQPTFGTRIGETLQTFPDPQVLSEAGHPYAAGSWQPPAVRAQALTVELVVPPRPGAPDQVDDISATARYEVDGDGWLPLRWQPGVALRSGGWAPVKVRAVRGGADDRSLRPLVWEQAGDAMFVQTQRGDRVVEIAFSGPLIEDLGSGDLSVLAGDWCPRPPQRPALPTTLRVVGSTRWRFASGGRVVERVESGPRRELLLRGATPGASVAATQGEEWQVRAEQSGVVVRVLGGLRTRFGRQAAEEAAVWVDRAARLFGPPPFDTLTLLERPGDRARIGPGWISLPQIDAPPNGLLTSRIDGRPLLWGVAAQWTAEHRAAGDPHDAWAESMLTGLATCLLLFEGQAGARCLSERQGDRERWRLLEGADGQSLPPGPLWQPDAPLGGAAVRLRASQLGGALHTLLGDRTSGFVAGLVAREGPVTTLAVLEAAQTLSGVDLRRWLFDWVYATPPWPRLVMRWATEQDERGWWWVLDHHIDPRADVTDRQLPVPLLLLPSEGSGAATIWSSTAPLTSRVGPFEVAPGPPRVDVLSAMPGAIDLRPR